jgi:hypothetical protein
LIQIQQSSQHNPWSVNILSHIVNSILSIITRRTRPFGCTALQVALEQEPPHSWAVSGAAVSYAAEAQAEQRSKATSMESLDWGKRTEQLSAQLASRLAAQLDAQLAGQIAAMLAEKISHRTPSRIFSRSFKEKLLAQ